jgi:hypothetical protein
MAKVIVRIKGGLGNQIFGYAAARRLALFNNAELVIDDVTGFVRDRQYRSQYMLSHFHISARKATPSERMEPFERYRRGVSKWLSRRKAFACRFYLEQEGQDFDERLLAQQVTDTIYLDGYWQSEGYFKDVEQPIREDLRLIPPTDAQNKRMAEAILNKTSVAIHVRWFETPESNAAHNISTDYYQRAIALMESKVQTPQYFVFSDDPEAARKRLSLPEGRATLVSHNLGQNNAFADMWLMTLCQHFIIANSTFSWWGAWLANERLKIVIAPNIVQRGISAWGFKGLIPDGWIQI